LGQVLSLDAARAWREQLREAGQTLVFTNGFFDLLHVGHARYLQAARALGDFLLVGLNSDASARALKPGRPVVPAEERAELVSALACVDAVVIFDEPTANEIVSAIRPDVYVKGGDWGRPGGRMPPEATVVAAYGGRVVYVPYVAERSTTALIAQIRGLPG
jgi:D-glycero-beta-D-manno-heptose 1-phosphate adenylyltransferase